MPQASATASMLAGDPSTGTRMLRTPVVGSDVATGPFVPTLPVSGAFRHYMNANLERQPKLHWRLLRCGIVNSGPLRLQPHRRQPQVTRADTRPHLLHLPALPP